MPHKVACLDVMEARVRDAFNRVGADDWDALRTRFRDPEQSRAAE